MSILQLVVTGRVQGVSFRAFTRRAARVLDLQGWVRNLRDGTVEVQVTGPATALEEFQRRLASGPAFARVDEVRVHPLEAWTEPPPEDGFNIIF